MPLHNIDYHHYSRSTFERVLLSSNTLISPYIPPSPHCLPSPSTASNNKVLDLEREIGHLKGDE